MENKCKKSTMQQLQALVGYMEENPQFARGVPVFGSSKTSTEKQWKQICSELNALGPPIRTIVEWKKTWADLKSPTKKKIADNMKSLHETGGGLYRVNNLSELEIVIERTLFLTKAAAPSGNVFGYEPEIEPVDNYFQTLVDTSPRVHKSVAVVTPTRQQQFSQEAEQQAAQHSEEPCTSSQAKRQRNIYTQNTQQSSTNQHSHYTKSHINPQSNTYQIPHTNKQSHIYPQSNVDKQPHINKQPPQSHIHQEEHINQQPDTIHRSPQQLQQKRQYQQDPIDNELPVSSSAKKRKVVSEQITLIRRQLRAGEETAATAKEQVAATKMLVEVNTRLANAAEDQADSLKRIVDVADALLNALNILIEQNKKPK